MTTHKMHLQITMIRRSIKITMARITMTRITMTRARITMVRTTTMIKDLKMEDQITIKETKKINLLISQLVKE